MKNFVRVISLMVVMVMAVCVLASCSTYGSIKSAFEDAGYTLQNADNEKTGEIKTEDGTITYTIHTFQKEAEKGDNFLENIGGVLEQSFSTAIVWEFSSSDDLAAAIDESATLKGLITDAQNSDYVNGNCVLTSINTEAVEIFKGTK